MTKTSPCSWGRIVPASTFKYMSILTVVTLRPWDWRMTPIEAEVTPLPRPETTPPDTKMYLMGIQYGRLKGWMQILFCGQVEFVIW